MYYYIYLKSCNLIALFKNFYLKFFKIQFEQIFSAYKKRERKNTYVFVTVPKKCCFEVVQVLNVLFLVSSLGQSNKVPINIHHTHF